MPSVPFIAPSAHTLPNSRSSSALHLLWVSDSPTALCKQQCTCGAVLSCVVGRCSALAVRTSRMSRPLQHRQTPLVRRHCDPLSSLESASRTRQRCAALRGRTSDRGVLPMCGCTSRKVVMDHAHLCATAACCHRCLQLRHRSLQLRVPLDADRRDLRGGSERDGRPSRGEVCAKDGCRCRVVLTEAGHAHAAVRDARRWVPNLNTFKTCIPWHQAEGCSTRAHLCTPTKGLGCLVW